MNDSNFCSLIILMMVFVENYSFYGVLTMLYFFLDVKIKFRGSSSFVFIHWFLGLKHIGMVICKTIDLTKMNLSSYFVVFLAINISTLMLNAILILMEENEVEIAWFVPLILYSIFAISSGGTLAFIEELTSYNFYIDKQKKRLMMYTLTEYLGKTYGAIQVGCFYNYYDFPLYFAPLLFLACGQICGLVTFIIGSYSLEIPHISRSEIRMLVRYIYNSLWQYTRAKKNPERASRVIDYFMLFEARQMKIVTSIIPLYLPLFFIISILEFKFSRYCDQVKMMSNIVGKGEPLLHSSIMPMYPAVVAICLPFLRFVLMPYYKKYYKKELSSFSRFMFCSYFLCFSVATACILETRLEKNRMEIVYEQTGNVMIYNAAPCAMFVQFEGYHQEQHAIAPMNMAVIKQHNIDGSVVRTAEITTTCFGSAYKSPFSIHISEQNTTYYLIDFDRKLLVNHYLPQPDTLDDDRNSTTLYPLLRIVYSIRRNLPLTFFGPDGTWTIVLNKNEHQYGPIILKTGMLKIYTKKREIISPKYFGIAGLYSVLIIQPQNRTVLATLLVTSEPNPLNLFYQMPQIIFLSMAETFITSKDFIYGREFVQNEYVNVLQIFWHTMCALCQHTTAMLGNIAYIQRRFYAFFFWFIVIMMDIAFATSLHSLCYKKMENWFIPKH